MTSCLSGSQSQSQSEEQKTCCCTKNCASSVKSIPARKSKIICTIGPASRSVEMLKKLALNGMDVARLNFSHGTHEEHLEVINNIRQVSEELSKPIAILQDLQGPKIRIGKLPSEVPVSGGDKIIITVKENAEFSREDNMPVFPTTYKALATDLNIGDKILVDDGYIKLEVLEKRPESLVCEVEEDGIIKSNKGINVPDLKLSTSALTEKDRKDLIFGLENGVEYVALSFVREAEDVRELKRLIAEKGSSKDVQVIAKIEKPQALDNLDEILDVTDVIMVARGDLGVELLVEKVPVAQKETIRKANIKGVPVITATQMLESMITNPNPTRAEASDVANAILDGTDAVMLSAETASGKFPVKAVQIMSKIIEEVEMSAVYKKNSSIVCSTEINDELEHEEEYFPQIIAEMVCESAKRINAKAVVVLTSCGDIARRISKRRTSCPIIALSPFEKTRLKVCLYWGVYPVEIDNMDVEEINTLQDITAIVDSNLLGHGLLQKGDPIVITFGSPLRIKGRTNLMKLHKVGCLNELKTDERSL